MKQFLILITLLCCTTFLSAQNAYEDVVYLINGGVIRGKIIENTSETIKIEILGGSLLVYKKAEILTVKREKISKQRIKKSSTPISNFPITRGDLDENGKPDHKYFYRDTGIYYNLMLGMMPGSDRFGDFSFGGAAYFSAGYHWNRFLGLGIGIGSDSYIDENVRTIFPVFAEFKGYVQDKAMSPYYNIAVGYGFANLSDDEFGMIAAKGGVYLNPRIGLRFPSKHKATFTFDIGYIYQKASYEFDNFIGRFKDDVVYKRINLRFGLLF